MPPLVYRFRLRPGHSIGRSVSMLGQHEKGYIYPLGAAAISDSLDVSRRITAGLSAALTTAPVVISNQFFT
jgi:hypothetical protein